MGVLGQQPLIVEFWDVGQGDCSVLHLPTGELILIDVGPRGNPLPGWLLRNQRSAIHSIVLTHNDADHIGALSAVIDACRQRIGTVYYLNDRSKKDEVFVQLNRRLVEARSGGEVKGLRRLETPLDIWQDSKCRLALNYPDVGQNSSASKPNDTSGILSLIVGSVTKVIWAGDSRIEYVAAGCAGAKPAFMVGPHHGAPTDRRDKRAVAWLRAVSPKKVVVSVGTNNSYPHPQPNYIRKVREAGGQLVCTQITQLCEDKLKLRDVVKSHGILGLPHPNKGFACRGPMRLTLVGEELVSTDNLDLEHAAEIRNLFDPKCIKDAPP